MNSTGLSINGDSISTAAGAQTAIANLDSAIATVNTTRADLGAKQNRFSATIRNPNSIAENVSASRSRIVDADFAMESAQLAETRFYSKHHQCYRKQINKLNYH